MLVPSPNKDGIEELLDALDGLVFSGGNDLEPVTRRESPSRRRHSAPDRGRDDQGERALLTAALERDLPVLAVCRGFQVPERRSRR